MKTKINKLLNKNVPLFKINYFIFTWPQILENKRENEFNESSGIFSKDSKNAIFNSRKLIENKRKTLFNIKVIVNKVTVFFW